MGPKRVEAGGTKNGPRTNYPKDKTHETKAPPLLSPSKSQGNRSITPDVTLKPPVTNHHRRTTSLQANEKPKVLDGSDAETSAKQTAHTILEQHIKIPWSETFRPGFGISALTGEFMARSALRPFKMAESSKPGKSRISVERLQWKGVTELLDGFEMEAGGTVNVLCPIGANVKIASVLSQNNSTSTILVQYKVEANFTADFVPENVRLKDGLDKLSDIEFRNEYGDYYIAGYQKAYSCRMIVVCKINEETVTKSLEREVVALVDRYFKGGIKISDIEKQTTSFSLLSVIVDTEGCSADPSSVFSVAVADAPQTLSKVLKNAPGVPRIAFLYHYSSLDSCNLSRRVDVPKDMFDRARIMRSLYAYLQASLLHPALQEFYFDRRTIHAVLEQFEQQRKSVMRMTKDDNKKINTLQRDLNSAKNKADALIRRYDFIRAVFNMDKGIVSHPPTPVNGLRFYRWDCGKTGAPKKLTEFKAYSLVCFESSYRAFELEWQSPVTDGSSTLRHLLGGPSAREIMSFKTRSSDGALPPRPPPSPKGQKLAKPRPSEPRPETEQDPGTFTFCLADHKPVYVLGWSISCYWPEGKAEPTIEVDHPTNYIFSDHLSISIDNSRSTRWYCKVTFVIKSSYNFPDLI
ncbi:FHA domain-containing protein [Mycena venus]|uniref:FHA domain-containing protein n=1 Tax=Mycena venus TaxID=2733690 RepID=A0A8H6Y438_9AGAR|nr:FHA domain-containing protein [Mycena venus]